MMRDDGISSVVGAIVVLAILGGSLLYVNAFSVPRQGASMEVQGGELAEAALLEMASALHDHATGPSVHEIPLQAPRTTPPLLAGVILSPARPPGTLALDETSTRLSVSALLDMPAGGVAVDDPIRVDAGSGQMRLYLLGNRTTGFPVGAISARVGGAYTESPEYRLEGGLLLANRSASSAALGRLGMFVDQDATTSIAWRLPLLAGGAQQVAGAGAQVGVRPGPESALGGSLVHGVTIAVETANVAAWREALEDALGDAATVVPTIVGDPDNGTVTATVLPPASVPVGTPAIEMRLWAVRYDTTLASR